MSEGARYSAREGRTRESMHLNSLIQQFLLVEAWLLTYSVLSFIMAFGNQRDVNEAFDVQSDMNTCFSFEEVFSGLA